MANDERNKLSAEEVGRLQEQWAAQFVEQGASRGYAREDIEVLWRFMGGLCDWRGELRSQGPLFSHQLLGHPGWGWEVEDIEAAIPGCARRLGRRPLKGDELPENPTVEEFVRAVLGADRL